MKHRSMLVTLLVISLVGSVAFADADDPVIPPAIDDAQFAEEMQAIEFRLPLRVVGTVTDAETEQPVKNFVVIPGSMEYQQTQ